MGLLAERQDSWYDCHYTPSAATLDNIFGLVVTEAAVETYYYGDSTAVDCYGEPYLSAAQAGGFISEITGRDKGPYGQHHSYCSIFGPSEYDF